MRIDAAGQHEQSVRVQYGRPVRVDPLRDGGDRIHGIAGVLSGSLAWLLSRHDGQRPFEDLVDEARALGYTEPDPRQDLSGEDVRRKLLILARAAGVALAPADVEVRALDAATRAVGTELAAKCVIGGAIANSIMKASFAISLGSPQLRRRITVVLGLTVVAGVLSLMFLI